MKPNEIITLIVAIIGCITGTIGLTINILKYFVRPKIKIAGIGYVYNNDMSGVEQSPLSFDEKPMILLSISIFNVKSSPAHLIKISSAISSSHFLYKEPIFFLKSETKKNVVVQPNLTVKLTSDLSWEPIKYPVKITQDEPLFTFAGIYTNVNEYLKLREETVAQLWEPMNSEEIKKVKMIAAKIEKAKSEKQKADILKSIGEVQPAPSRKVHLRFKFAHKTINCDMPYIIPLEGAYVGKDSNILAPLSAQFIKLNAEEKSPYTG